MKIIWGQEDSLDVKYKIWRAQNVGKLHVGIYFMDHIADKPYWELRSLTHDNREYFVEKALTKEDLTEAMEEAEELLIEKAKEMMGVLV